MMLGERSLHRSGLLPRRESRKLFAIEASAIEPAYLAGQLL